MYNVSNTDNERCIICYEDLIYSDTCILKCNHRFHLSCFLNWKKHNCPLCRENYQMLFHSEYNIRNLLYLSFLLILLGFLIAIAIFSDCIKK
jgi:hypothetical protein